VAEGQVSQRSHDEHATNIEFDVTVRAVCRDHHPGTAPLGWQGVDDAGDEVRRPIGGINRKRAAPTLRP
jgi:hypothetical protein